MKHFVKKHRHHFGLWLISALVLVASTFWLKSVDKQLARLDESASRLTEQMTDQSSIAAAPASLSPAQSPSQAALTNQGAIKEKVSGAETSQPNIQPAENPSLPAPSSSAPEENKISVSFKIIASDWKKDFSLTVPAKSTVYEAMVLLNERGLIPIVFKQFSGLGAFVQSIGGLENSGRDNQFWIYYRNGAAAPVGISNNVIQPNDLIEWKYEKPNL